MSFQIGETVGDYRLTGLLPDLASSTELADRFIREIRLQASLSHPSIAVLHTAFRANTPHHADPAPACPRYCHADLRSVGLRASARHRSP